ncbi:uncharacterized protein COX7B [Centruroides vittatus]|uniref:uncharacterized protein COX7B n=1 Tax=Centruroides vittatus TaxID=120091 RepID=UPI003510CB7C
MISRILLTRLARTFPSNVRTKYTSDLRPVTVNDLLVPSGPWKEGYEKLQSKFNKHLILGVTFFTVTVITAYTSGCLELHMMPPKESIYDESGRLTEC